MDASPVAAFFARSGPALQKVIDGIAAQAVDQSVVAMGFKLEEFREELLAPSVAWLQLERRVQELEAAAAEQGATQSWQGRVVHVLQGKVQDVDGRVQGLHGNVRWPPEDSQHRADEDLNMVPTPAAEE